MDFGGHRVILKKLKEKKGELLIESVVSFIIFIVVLAGVTAVVMTSVNMNKEAGTNAAKLEKEIKAAENDTVTGGTGGIMTINIGGKKILQKIKIKKQESLVYFGGNGAETQQELGDETMSDMAGYFQDLLSGSVTDGSGNTYTGEDIFGVDSHEPGTFGYEIYSRLTGSEKDFADDLSWSVLGSGGAYRIYFTLSHYGSTDSASNVRVYAFDGDTGLYRYSQTGTEVENGQVYDSGSYWSAWGSSVDEWQ